MILHPKEEIVLAISEIPVLLERFETCRKSGREHCLSALVFLFSYDAALSILSRVTEYAIAISIKTSIYDTAPDFQITRLTLQSSLGHNGSLERPSACRAYHGCPKRRLECWFACCTKTKRLWRTLEVLGSRANPRVPRRQATEP
jgi:hypothetical protein